MKQVPFGPVRFDILQLKRKDRATLNSIEELQEELDNTLTSVSGNPITISDSSNTNAEGLTATLSPTQASGTPTPSNPLEISGVSTLSVNRTGKNIAPFVDNAVASVSDLTVTTTSDGGIHISGTPSVEWAGLTSAISMHIPSGTTITLSRSVATNYRMYIRITYTDNTTEDLQVLDRKTYATKTLSKDVSTIKLYLSVLSTSKNYNETIYPQLEIGSSATPYEPYQGTSITLNLGSTIYGGSVDLRSGVLTVDRVIIDLKDQTITKNSGVEEDTNYTYQIANSDLSASGNFSEPTLFLSNVMTYTSSLPSSGGQFTVRETPGTGYLYFNIGELSPNTVEQCKISLTSLGAKLVYPLATPVTTQLTAKNLRLLQGINTIWSNGDNLSFSYQPNNLIGELKAWVLDQLS